MARTGSADPVVSREALERLFVKYRGPLLQQVKGSRIPADMTPEDVLHAFFAKMIAERGFARATPERGSFRVFIHRCLDNFIRHLVRDRNTIKRGRNVVHVSLTPASQLSRADERPDTAFGFDRDRAWASSVLDHASARLRKRYVLQDREVRFDLLLAAAKSEQPASGYLAERLGIKPASIRKALSDFRAQLRTAFIEEVRLIIDDTGRRRDLDDELRTLMGALERSSSPNPHWLLHDPDAEE